MNPSTEIRDAMLRMYAAHASGDAGAILRLISRQEGVLAIGTDPIVFAQTTLAVQPCQGPFDDPSHGQHLKADLTAEFLDDLQRPAQGVLHPIHQLTSIAAIGPDELQTTPVR